MRHATDPGRPPFPPGLRLCARLTLAAALLGAAGLMEIAMAGTGRTVGVTRGVSALPQQAPGTPIVDPVPVPRPLFLPLALRRYDPHLPGALTTVLDGFVTTLEKSGRDLCAPATHVLLTGVEGSPGAEVVGVLYTNRPELDLDFYLNLCVQVSGPISLTPPGCQQALTWQSMEVTAIKDKGICALGATARKTSVGDLTQRQ